MKTLKKIGLVAAIIGGLTLGGLNSKSLETNIPRINVPIANAEEVNPQGYELPDLKDKAPDQRYFHPTHSTVLVEKFDLSDDLSVTRMSRNGKTFAYGCYNPSNPAKGYTVVDNDGNGTFETKYFWGEPYYIPEWVFK